MVTNKNGIDLRASCVSERRIILYAIVVMLRCYDIAVVMETGLEREPGVTDAFDVEERLVWFGAFLVEHPARSRQGCGSGGRRTQRRGLVGEGGSRCRRDERHVADDGNAQRRMRLEAEGQN